MRGVEFREAAVECDAVLEVDDEIAFDQLGKIQQLVNLRALGGDARVERRTALALAPEDLGLGDNDEADRGGRRFFPREREAGPGAKRNAKTFVECAAEEAGFDEFQHTVLGEDFLRALFLALLGDDEHHAVAGLAPCGDLHEERAPRVLLDLQALLRDERGLGIAAVVREALGIPCGLKGAGVKESAGFVEVAHAKGCGAFFEKRREAVESLTGECAELFLERGRFDEDQVRARREIIGEAGFRRAEFYARRCG